MTVAIISIMTVAIMKKKKKKLKTRVGMFKNMGGNISGEDFLGGNFPSGSFPDTVSVVLFYQKN